MTNEFSNETENSMAKELGIAQRFIVLNQIRTPDGTILRSVNRHDYRTYIDKNGKEYMVDGGSEYLRRNVHDDAPYDELSIYSDDSFDVIRRSLHWGTYGPKGDQPKRYVAMSDLSDDHIKAILVTQSQVQGDLRQWFETELAGRKQGIYPSVGETL
jgi:hypothetical protein